jgi:glycerophosphoryl diester phosphodiesterase
MKRPLLVGHRGARALSNIPENTLPSFEACLQHGCDGFEFDVRRSSDDEAVICHDPSVCGVAIAQAAANSLALPSLGEVLRHFSRRAFLDIELKVAGLEATTVAELAKSPPQRGYVVSSFLPEVLTAINELDSAIPLGFLCETRAELDNWRAVPADWVIPRFDIAGRELIEAVHADAKKIMVWTINRPKLMCQFADWGVDAIISDETELLRTSLQ